MALMIEELDTLNRGLEKLVAVRTEALRDSEAQLKAQNLRFEAAVNNMPQALLMFGLADRTAHVRIETRARNAVTTLFPDADRNRARKGSIISGADAMMFGPHTAKLLRAAVGTGVDARASRDAGSYLCNYLSWRAIEAVSGDNGPRLAAFVHVPLLKRDGTSPRKDAKHRVTLEELVDAGEAMLLELVKLTRQATPERLKPVATS